MNYSIIIPVYKNEENIPSLLIALREMIKRYGKDIEVVFVIDGSPDNSYTLLKESLPKQNFSSQLIQLSKNFGSFIAIRTGLAEAQGNFYAVMAADLQEPPELIYEFFKILSSNQADVVFGRREGRDDHFFSSLFSRIFWYLYRKFVIKDIPKGGVDIFGCNRIVRSSLLSIEEPNSSLISQLFWVGYQRKFVPYKRRGREHGKSAWSLSKRIEYMLDSIFSFTDLPIMIILWLGIFGITISAITAVIILIAKIRGLIPVLGYTPIMLSILFFSSLTLLTQGIIGMYLWRTFENSKKRPIAIIANRQSFTP